MNCKTCGKPEGHGYLIDQNHFEKDNFRSSANAHQIWYNVSMYAPFVIYPIPGEGNKAFLPAQTCIDTLENWGVDLCDDIPMDEPLVTVKLEDGECAWCIADENQLKLF